ncbi:MAG: recombinase family protein [Kiritimatiellae bacterium]|nr:recombinase family protein [Kiritimatiellia bacterium]
MSKAEKNTAAGRKDAAAGRTFGYARVSSSDQNCARQIAALCAAGVEKSSIFVDHKSGRDFDRPAWKKMRRILRQGDLLVMQTLDRFGRSYDYMVDEWQNLVNRKGVDIRILDMPILDTRQGIGNLTGKFIFDIVLRLLSYLAETERTNIRERQRQGIAIARSKGVVFGRPRIKLTPERRKYLADAKAGRMEVGMAAAACKVSMSTMRRWMNVTIPPVKGGG